MQAALHTIGLHETSLKDHCELYSNQTMLKYLQQLRLKDPCELYSNQTPLRAILLTLTHIHRQMLLRFVSLTFDFSTAEVQLYKYLCVTQYIMNTHKVVKTAFRSMWLSIQ